jgi:hypothetical protein
MRPILKIDPQTKGHFHHNSVTKVTPQDQSAFQSVIALKEQQLQAQQQQLRQLQPWRLSQKGKAYKQPSKFFSAKMQSGHPASQPGATFFFL